MARQAKPWRIKDVSAKARAAAEGAAGAEGVPVGQWIDRVILQAAPPPEPEAEPEVKAAAGRRYWMAGVSALTVAAAALAGWWFYGGPDIAFFTGGGGGAGTATQALAPSPPSPPIAPFPKTRTGTGTGADAELIRLRTRAAGGDMVAQRDLAVMYLKGEGVAKDGNEAVRLFEQAAAQQSASARFYLGVLYEAGRGVPKDQKRAISWYLLAAEQDHTEAQHNLATLYALGRGTPRNYDLARRWFTKAAEAGAAASQLSLGKLYEHGLGVEEDTQSAIGWYRRAAAAGSTEAANRLNLLAAQEERDAAARDQPAVRLGRKGVAEIQRLLTALSFEPGPADGDVGSRTTAAIKLYQQFADLPVDGVAGAGLRNDLRKVVGAMKHNAGR